MDRESQEAPPSSLPTEMALLDALPTAIGLVKRGVVVWVNLAFTRVLGYSKEEALGQGAAKYFADLAAYERAMSVAEPLLARGDSYSTDLLMRRNNGECFWGTVVGRAIDASRPESGIIWMLSDITERHEAEERLKTSEASLARTQARLESAQTQAKIGSWEYDTVNGETYWSKEMFRLLKREPSLGAAQGPEALQVAPPEEQSKFQEAAERALATRETVLCEHRGPEENGESPRYFATAMAAVRDESGKVLYLAGTTQDITERKIAENALRASEQRRQRLIQNSNDIITVLDVQSKHVSFWGPLMATLGYSPEELIQEDALLRMHPEDVPRAQQVIKEAIAHPGVTYRLEYRYRHKLGHWVPMEAVGTSWLHDPSIDGILINLREVSERKEAEQQRIKLEEQLQQVIKMEAIGRLAGGVAHDFNNLLTVITGNVELALSELNPADPLTQYLREVTEAANSAASLTRQLLAFSRRQLIATKVVNLNDLITSLRKMLGRLIGEDIALNVHLAHELGAVRIDPGQFDQVIINLAVNARDAMPKGGQLTIETDNVDLDSTACDLNHDLHPGRFVRLSVSDTGEGIAQDRLNHIFEPFFTTKPVGAGTGLGLSVIFGVVKQAGGIIETHSQLGVGTTFKVYLPRVDEAPQELEPHGSPMEPLRGNETILLVEDNENVRELTANMLKRLGYVLLVADNGKTAYNLVVTQRPAIDLLLTDLVMPSMSGRELTDKVRETYPNLPVLYCSGYTEDTFVRHGLATESLTFISKPFTLYQLGLKVRQLLDEKRTTLRV